MSVSRDLTKLTKEELVEKIDGLIGIQAGMMEIFLWVHREIGSFLTKDQRPIQLQKELNEKLRELDDKYKIRN
jgi:hypothetical protein